MIICFARSEKKVFFLRINPNQGKRANFFQKSNVKKIFVHMRGKEIDRLPVIEWAPWWNLTIDRWNGERLGILYKDSRSVLEIQRHFGLDGCVQSFFHVRGPKCPVAPSHGAGIMKNEADYEKIKPFLFPDPADFCNKQYVEFLNKTREDGDTIHWFTVEGFFWYPRELFGIESHLFSFYDEPELLKRMCADYVDWIKKVVEFIGNTFRFDFMSFAEDMSYNNGPMLSKELFDEFLAPYYNEVIPLIKKIGIPVFVDSDGDITKAVDWYAEVGANGMFPLERQAGVDVSLYLEKQKDMFFFGHFNKMCMKFGKEAMRAEFERLLPSIKTGRFIPSVDHQTPPDVSYENYLEYVKLLKEYTRV